MPNIDDNDNDNDDNLHPRIDSLRRALKHYICAVVEMAQVSPEVAETTMQLFAKDMMEAARVYQQGERSGRKDASSSLEEKHFIEQVEEVVAEAKAEALVGDTWEACCFSMVRADGHGFWVKRQVCPDRSKNKADFTELEKYRYLALMDAHFRRGKEKQWLARDSVVEISAKSQAYTEYQKRASGAVNTGKGVVLIRVDDAELVQYLRPMHEEEDEEEAD